MLYAILLWLYEIFMFVFIEMLLHFYELSYVILEDAWMP